MLRPITKRVRKEKLYRFIAVLVKMLLPSTRWLKRIFGRVGARLSPIVEYTHLGLTPELNTEWAVLDTFDMYSPTHDHTKTLTQVRRWFSRVGFVDVRVFRGPNGIVARGRRPSE